jgi:hypothetical protein
LSALNGAVEPKDAPESLSIAIGSLTGATIPLSIALGRPTAALVELSTSSSPHSTATDNVKDATESLSIAVNNVTDASQSLSIAIGSLTVACIPLSNRTWHTYGPSRPPSIALAKLSDLSFRRSTATDNVTAALEPNPIAADKLTIAAGPHSIAVNKVTRAPQSLSIAIGSLTVACIPLSNRGWLTSGPCASPRSLRVIGSTRRTGRRGMPTRSGNAAR